LTGYAKLGDARLRRAAIDEARQRGSAPRDVLVALRRARKAGRVRVLQGEVVRARFDRSLGPELWLRAGEVVHADRIVLATGFARGRPGRWLDAAIEREQLPLAPCGFPLVDAALRWHPRIHVSGPLAELEIGPVARNIAGARMAAERIVPPPRASVRMPEPHA
jgi:glycine/D-amino acid oxidase-like deaminating enzyme